MSDTTTTTPSARDADDAMIASLADYTAEAFTQAADGGSATDAADDPTEFTTDETSSDDAAADDAGTTPAESAAAASGATPRTAQNGQGTKAAGTTPPGTPQAGAAQPASTVPLPYAVDGQSRAFPGVQVALDAAGKPTGATVALDALPQLQQRLARADYYETQNQHLYREVQRFHGLEVQGEGGQALRGMAAVEHLAVENARLVASTQFLAQALENPQIIERLALAQAAGDESAIQALGRELNVIAREARITSRDQWRTTVAARERETATTANESELKGRSIAQSIDHWAKQFPGLTDADLQRAFTYLAREGSGVFRKANPAEARAANVRPGQYIVDHPAVHAYLTDLHALVQRGSAATTAAADATRENEQRLAAARAGQRGGRRGGRAPNAPGAAVATTEKPAAHGGFAEIREKWLSGQFYEQDQ